MSDMELLEDFLSNYLYAENLSRVEVAEMLFENIDELDELLSNIINNK